MDKNSKRMTPQECEQLFVCRDGKEHPDCPIFDWCMSHVFQPDSCEQTWTEYFKALDQGTL